MYIPLRYKNNVFAVSELEEALDNAYSLCSTACQIFFRGG
jgi:hypothetical protein